MLNGSTPATVKHLRELKERTDKNIETRCATLAKQQIEQRDTLLKVSSQMEDMSVVIKAMRAEISQLRGELVAARANINRLQGEVNNTKHIATDCMQNLANVEQSLVCSGDSSNKAYEKVIRELNDKVMPKLNSTLNYIHHHLEDPNEVINEYRYSVSGKRPNFSDKQLFVANLSL